MCFVGSIDTPGAQDMKLVTTDRPTALRDRIENFIRERFEADYGARIETFAPRLVAALEGDAVVCAAGLRDGAEVFFSEHYLDDRAERTIARLSGKATRRSEILEVSSLCGLSPRTSIPFIHGIARDAFEQGYSWAIFAATDRLRRLLDAIELAPIELAVAARERVPDPAAWGSYYETKPVVLAVGREAIGRDMSTLEVALAARRDRVGHDGAAKFSRA